MPNSLDIDFDSNDYESFRKELKGLCSDDQYDGALEMLFSSYMVRDDPVYLEIFYDVVDTNRFTLP